MFRESYVVIKTRFQYEQAALDLLLNLNTCDNRAMLVGWAKTLPVNVLNALGEYLDALELARQSHDLAAAGRAIEALSQKLGLLN